MEFTKKNDFIVKNKKDEHFEKDLDLFKMKCPVSNLHTEVKRLNSFNRSKIHGMILVELLDKVSPEEILQHRQETTEEIQDPGETPIVDTVEGVKEIFAAEMDLELIEEEVFPYLVGRTVEEIKVLIALTKSSVRDEISVQKQPPIVETVEDVKSIVAVEMDIENFPEEVFTNFIGKTADEIKTIITFGKTIKTIDNEISQETGRKTTGNSGSEIQNPNPDPENGSISDGTSQGEVVSKPEGENQSGILEGTGEGVGNLESKIGPEQKMVSGTSSKPKQPAKPAVMKNLPKKKGVKKKSSRK